jgi:hypothetical protein
MVDHLPAIATGASLCSDLARFSRGPSALADDVAHIALRVPFPREAAKAAAVCHALRGSSRPSSLLLRGAVK